MPSTSKLKSEYRMETIEQAGNFEAVGSRSEIMVQLMTRTVIIICHILNHGSPAVWIRLKIETAVKMKT